MEDIELAVNKIFEEKKPMILEQRYRTNGGFTLNFYARVFFFILYI